MRLLAPAISTALLMLAATPASASTDPQLWETLTVNVALPDNFRLSSESVFRVGDAKGFYEIEENLMVGRKLNSHVTAWLGYTFNPTYLHGDFRRREHRFRQQVNFDNVLQFGSVRLGGRVRMEERWREGFTGTGWRLRPQIKATVPLKGKTALSVSSEPFFNLNTTGFQTVRGLDRVRNAVSINTPLIKNVNLEVGYLNQHGFVRNGPDSSDHVLTLGLITAF
jgi:Protein of unknown function (DUF2490)